MIDADKVKAFWDGRVDAYRKVALKMVANLEQDENNLHLKINDETQKVFDWLPPVDGLEVLDWAPGWGSGVFASLSAMRVAS
ncbi:hypothetical protein [Castellaniella sp.]|uniref:hypothetical protein n=1 Tax=Castellaniella sp. TaxID=1955812 RepID=UPI002AFFA82E|nr:hypothetical protein [Castellaniella sp.]